jgi:AcrR family transcriptional regulator
MKPGAEPTIMVKSIVTDPELVERRRAQVIKVATKLFASNGFHGTKVKDIATLADVSPGLIYQYFGEKHDILYLAIMWVVREKLARLNEALDAHSDPVKRFEAVVEEYIRINDEHHHAVILIYREIQCLPREYITDLQELEIKTNALIGQAVTDGVAAGVFKDTSPDFIAHVIVSLAQAWPTKHWRLKTRGTLDAYIAETKGLLLDALKK